MVRLKNRYLLFDIVWEDGTPPPFGLREGAVLSAIRESIRTHFGDYGAGALGGALQLKHFNSETGKGILRAPRDSYRTAWAALTLMTGIERHRCFFRVIHLGGTIRSCQRVAVRVGLGEARLDEEQQQQQQQQQESMPKQR